MAKPKHKSIDEAEKKFNHFQEEVAKFNPLECKAPVVEQEEQTKLSSKEMRKTDAPYIKPTRSIGCKEQFNEKLRKKWEDGWTYIKCVVENYEILGETVHTWTKKFPGDPAHEWKVPVNKPIYIPKLLAKQLSECKYHRLVMEDTPTNAENGMTYYGNVIATHTKHRIDVKPVADDVFSFTGA